MKYLGQYLRTQIEVIQLAKQQNAVWAIMTPYLANPQIPVLQHLICPISRQECLSAAERDDVLFYVHPDGRLECGPVVSENKDGLILGQPSLPVVWIVDKDTQEATGTTYRFCSQLCRTEMRKAVHPSEHQAFVEGDEPAWCAIKNEQCANCGKELR